MISQQSIRRDSHVPWATRLDEPLQRLAKEDGIPGAHFMDYLPAREAAHLVRGLAPLIRRLRRVPTGTRSPRSLKRTLRVGVPRGKTPDPVREEVRAHVPAYDPTRTVTARAAARHDTGPRSISFGGRSGRSRPSGR